MKTNKGFTLIELLVVVAIIGILSTIVISSLSNARSRSRDASRLSDIKTIQTALEIYYVDNGTYPDISAGSHVASWATLEGQLGMTLPIDPVNTSTGTTWNDASIAGNYVYSYKATDNATWCYGKMYAIYFQLEGRNGDGPLDGVQRCTTKLTYGNSFVVGVDRDGGFIVPDLSGTPK